MVASDSLSADVLDVEDAVDAAINGCTALKCTAVEAIFEASDTMPKGLTSVT